MILTGVKHTEVKCFAKDDKLQSGSSGLRTQAAICKEQQHLFV